MFSDLLLCTTSNLKAARLQQQKTIPGVTSVNKNKKAEAIIHADLPKLDSDRLERHCLLQSPDLKITHHLQDMAQLTEVPKAQPMPRITLHISGDLKRRCNRCKSSSHPQQAIQSSIQHRAHCP
ncbi:hypothetical protein ILYODFUR_012126 [Ilyodon furcidens]|uniref:Uncharacterized protein n=1 Tax=Ilyodon furcidens TaxID=33524 RepID=A0ABV0V2E5_9TELE